MSTRYEDIAQDGRVVLDAIPHVVGDVLWPMLLAHGAVAALLAEGTLPILSRLVVEGTGGPVAVRDSFEGTAAWQLAHTVGESGEVDRVLLNLRAEVFGPRGRSFGPQPDGAGERIHLGRVFAEHVFTRPFGPPEDRKVLRLDAPGVPAIPPERYVWRPPEELCALPAGAEPLDEPGEDEASVVFGLSHTDSNQHINSLVYPRLFEEAALRRFARLGKTAPVLARFVELAFRKPCFAGDRVRVVLRAFGSGARLGAVGWLVPETKRDARPYCWARVAFEP